MPDASLIKLHQTSQNTRRQLVLLKGKNDANGMFYGRTFVFIRRHVVVIRNYFIHFLIVYVNIFTRELNIMYIIE